MVPISLSLLLAPRFRQPVGEVRWSRRGGALTMRNESSTNVINRKARKEGKKGRKWGRKGKPRTLFEDAESDAGSIGR